MLQTHTIDLSKFKIGEVSLSMIRMLVTTKEELLDFSTNFWKGESTAFFAINTYRLHRIKQKNVSLELFIMYYASFGLQDALESLFMMPIQKDVTNAIESKILNGTLTLQEIYDKFSSDNMINPTRFAHNRR